MTTETQLILKRSHEIYLWLYQKLYIYIKKTPIFQCSDVHKQPSADRCKFVDVTDDCQIDEGFLDYTYFVYCDFSTNLLPLGVVILVRNKKKIL